MSIILEQLAAFATGNQAHVAALASAIQDQRRNDFAAIGEMVQTVQRQVTKRIDSLAQRTKPRRIDAKTRPSLVILDQTCMAIGCKEKDKDDFLVRD